MNQVETCINFLSGYKSHYCRTEASKKYLPPQYTLELIHGIGMYRAAVENPVSSTVYWNVFRKCGIKIKNPKKDTC